jgi:alginate O-acetyltransferase complex protein AlgI
VLFTSSAFLLIFLPATVAAYALVPARARIWLLLVASYAFYLSWRPSYGLLLAASTIVNYGFARRMPLSPSPKKVLATAVAFNLAILAYFKYAGMFTSSAASLLDWLGVANDPSYQGLKILLPLAISFFTFEMISVQVDVYRGTVRVGDLLTFATYKAFFPKLVSGPITRYSELAPQLERLRPLDFDRFQSGVALFTLGLAKKLVLADNLAPAANALFAAPATASGGATIVGILCFGLQIYFDFSAYTDMARGVSRIVGLELPRNFRFPYAATSPSDFWQRWHMSLSRWLRDYVYIPLGGNRKGPRRTYVNLFATMALGGLWHGAAWHFMAWGAMHGGFLTVSHGLRGKSAPRWVPVRLIGRLATLAAVFAAWVFFRAASFGQAIDVFKALGHPIRLSEPTALATGPSVAVVLLACVAILLATPQLEALGRRLRDGLLVPSPGRAVALAASTILAWTAADVLSRSSTLPFIYFHF